MPQSAGEYWTTPEWREAFGFDLFQVEQAVNYSDVPFDLTLLRGSFDPAELRAAWANSGYQPVDLGSGEAYAVRPDFEIDLSSPVSRMTLGRLNVVALADDGTLITGSTRDAVRQALAATNGLASSFAERPDIAPLVRAAPPDLVSAMILPGTLLRAVGDPVEAIFGDESPESFATRVAAEVTEARRLPQILAVLLGETEGLSPSRQAAAPMTTPVAPLDGPPARHFVILSTRSPEAAAEAATVITERLNTQRAPEVAGEALANRPWNELFSEWTVQAIAGEPAVLIELVPAAGTPASLVQRLVFVRIPGFLAWAP